MKTILQYHVLKRAALFLLSSSLLISNCAAQLNISQKITTLDFRPVTSGQLTFWESSTHPLDTGYSNLSVFDGQHVKVLDRSNYGTGYEVHASGTNAIYKKFGDAMLYYYKNGEIIPLEKSLKKYYSVTSLISEEKAAWMKSDGIEIGTYDGNAIKALGITPFDSREKSLLSLDGNTLAYITGSGDYVLVQWVDLPFGPASFDDANNFIFKLNTYAKPANFFARGKKYAWTEYDGTDSEIFFYDSEQNTLSTQQITNNSSKDTLPVIGANGQIAWISNSNGQIAINLYYNNQLTQVASNSAEKTNLEFSGNLLTWLEKIPNNVYTDYDLIAFDGLSPAAKMNETPVLAYEGVDAIFTSDKYVVWREDSSLYYYDGVIKKHLKLPAYGIDDPKVSGSTLVWVKYYGEDIYLFDMDNGNVSKYAIDTVVLDKCQQSKFAQVSFSSKDSIIPGIIGFDFKMKYDTVLFAPTGYYTLHTPANGYVKAAINTGIKGQVIVSIYLSGAPVGEYISGKGKLIDIEFQQKQTLTTEIPYFTTGEVEQSFINSSFKTFPADTGYTSVSQTIVAELNYVGDPAERIIYDAASPDEYLPTEISMTTNGFCRPLPLAVTSPDIHGKFEIPEMPGLFFSIKRDIPGDTAASLANVMPVINSADRNKALAIANYSYTNPTLPELLAADVNLDGKVTSGDVSLISSRTINAIHEFPQKGNYIWNGNKYIAGPAYIKSKDWLFTDSIDLRNFQYGLPVSRDYVPTISNCLYAGGLTAGRCSLNFLGILLGDVAHSWKSSDGGNLRKSSEELLIFDFSHAVSEADNYYSIPVKVLSANPVTGLDFTLSYNKSQCSIEGVYKNSKYKNLDLLYNNVLSKQLKVTSFDAAGFLADDAIMFIRIKATDITSLNRETFKINGYLNGIEIPVELPIITGVGTESRSERLQLLPNPTAGACTVIAQHVIGQSKIEIMNLSGATLKEFTTSSDQDSFRQELDLSEIPAGAYLVKMTTSNGVVIEKLIKY